MSDSKIRMTAVPADRTVQILRRSGSRHASDKTLQLDTDAGAPANADGTMNLVEFTAWLIRELSLGH